MKTNKIFFIIGLVFVFSLSSCINDLDTKPISKNTGTTFSQDAVFTKVYATLGLTGTKPDESDVAGIDAGTSSFYRMIWSLNEFPSDEGIWRWNDPGFPELMNLSWTGENVNIKGLYYRFITDIKFCNHFLEYADQSNEYGQQQAAEVRFIRALNYWYLLDFFKFSPFVIRETTSSTDFPDFYSRPQLFEWLEGELKELTTALPVTRLSKYRVDQTAAWLLLGRLYLNAEVYTGEARWQDAQNAADQAISGGYTLLKDVDKTNKDGIKYSSYQQLFMGDNDVNGAQDEAVLLIYQDGFYCRNYGGSQFCIASMRDGGMLPWGYSAQWNCFRSSPTLIYKFFTEADTILKLDEYHMPQAAHDDRAIFCSYAPGHSGEWHVSGGMSDKFTACWACCKFTNVYSTADSLSHMLGSNPDWPDTDIPFLRIAEAYLTKAEAMYRLGDVSGAMDLINNTIRARAHAEPLTEINEEVLCDEWCREFWCEGRRRTDLIRFGRFAGSQADANQYNWEGRGGSTTAASFVSVGEKFNWYPVPSDDKKINPNFKLQVVDAPDALEGGDGYTYVSN